ncbi:MAG: hypothetical protein ACR2P3_00100, partial [Geminicoccaceae bacterium]
MISLVWPALSRAQTANGHPFDIGIIIDNRPLAANETARADVDALLTMLDRQMFIEHIMVFERPTIEVICDIFGCPGRVESDNLFPSLIWQITREEEARLFVYYLGGGRTEGLERQLLFKRQERSGPDDVAAFGVDWLHAKLKEAAPASVVLMLDTSFAPSPLPCLSEDPLVIGNALSSARRIYQRIMRDHRVPDDHFELAATTSAEPPLCDRFSQLLEEVDQPLFTKFILKGIVDGEADLEPFGDQDRLIDLGELTAYLDDHIRRTARFQWGRPQNVRAVGSQSRVLASVDGRALSKENTAFMKRRNRPPEPDAEQKIVAATPEEKAGDDEPPETEPQSLAARCRDDPTAKDCHPCVLEPGSEACAEHCRQDGDSNLCASNLTSSTETGVATRAGTSGAPGVIVVPGAEDEQADEGIGERSAACRWVADNAAPYASTLVETISGDTAASCAWAMDRLAVERGPFAEVFTPVGWRLGRASFQDAVICLLDCGDATAASNTVAASIATAAEGIGSANRPLTALQS